MKIDQLKRLAMQHSTVTYATEQDECDSEFVVIALSKFAKLVKVAEAARRLVDNTPHEPIGYVHTPPANMFFDLETKLASLESK